MSCTIQWKIPDYHVLAILLQQIGRVQCDKTLPTISIVFIDSKHVLPDDIVNVRDNPFRDHKTALKPNDSMQTAKIISTFYENNFKTRKSRL